MTNACEGTVLNSFVSSDSVIPDRICVEDSVIEHSTIGSGCIISNVDIKDLTVPDDIVLHGLKLRNGRYVCRIYGKNDDPKASSNASFLNGSISDLIKNTGISPEDVWEKDTASIWNARIYPECDTMEEAAAAALEICKMVQGVISPDAAGEWRRSVRHSLSSSFYEADVKSLIARQQSIGRKVKVDLFVKALEGGEDMTSSIDSLNTGDDAAEDLIVRISSEADNSPFPQNMRIYLACADLCRKYGIDNEQNSYSGYEDLSYKAIKDTVASAAFKRFDKDRSDLRIATDSVTAELPVRINFCGSPSDAAPYCLEHGGTMIDGAVTLNGKLPIRVTARRITEKEIRFGSSDQGCKDAFRDLSDILDLGDPFDPYALHKAVLAAACIVTPDDAEAGMDKFCDRIGGGIELITEADVPKGSGLGTSSIIAAAAVRAVSGLFGTEATDEMIYSQVFLAEQLMNTGGGWQDQVGGLRGGIKYFTSAPGPYQKIDVDVLNIPDETMAELNERFALIFSGQRRLARNVLREEMNQTIRNNKDALESIKKIREYCAVMRYHILQGDITSFAKYITAQFELVKTLDKGASNTCIEYIFDVCGDLIDGRSVCGAGGGGFLQVILKKGVTKDDLRERIRENFRDCGVEVWDSEFI